MKIACAAIAFIAILGTFASAQPLKLKQLSNNSAVVLSPKKSVPSLKEFQLDQDSLEKMKFRLGKERDVGPLLRALGPGSTGGGDSCFQRVVTNYVRLVTGLRMGVIFHPGSYTNENLLGTLDKIEIQMGQNLTFKGRPVEALNVPKHNLVIVDKKICGYLKNYDFDKRMMGLLLHEAFGVAKIPDQEYQESSKLLSQIEEFSQGLTTREEEPWLVIAEFMKQVEAKGSALEKALENSEDAYRDIRESVNYSGIKIIKTGEDREGRAMDWGPECEPYEKRKQECAINWSDNTVKYLIIVTKNLVGSGWTATAPFYVEFGVLSSSRSLTIGDPESGETVILKDEKPKARLLKIMGPDY